MRSLIILPLTLLALASAILTGCGNDAFPVTPPHDFEKLEIAHSEVLTNPPDYSFDTQLAVNPLNGEIFVAWARKIGGATEIFWRHGQPGAFSAEEVITKDDGIKSWNPAITAGRDGRVHFAYMDQEIDGVQKEVYSKTWSGGIWGDEVLLSLADGWTGWDPDVETYPDGRPVVAWFDHRFGVQHEILLRIGDGNGMWWPDVRMTNDNHWQTFPDIDIDLKGKVHLSYVDTRHVTDEWGDADKFGPGNNLEIYYRTWSGGQPESEIRVSNTPLRSLGSHIATDGFGNAHMIYLDESAYGHYVLYYVKIENNIVSSMTPVSHTNTRADVGAIECLGDRIFIVWPEYPDIDGPSYSQTKLYIREILQDGRAGQPLLLASSNANLHPTVEVDEKRGMVWTAWMEYLGDDEELIEGESRIRLAGVGLKP